MSIKGWGKHTKFLNSTAHKFFFHLQTIFHFNMTKIDYVVPFMIPRNFMGEWRLIILGTFKDEGGKTECGRGRFDLIDMD